MQASRPTPNILLVEDDDVDAMLFKRSLGNSPLRDRVTRVVNGLQALDALRGDGELNVQRPSIVVLDLKMPEMDGLEFLAELRKTEGLSETVVFVLTTSDAPSDVQGAYSYHVAGYFQKALSTGHLTEFAEFLERYTSCSILPGNV